MQLQSDNMAEHSDLISEMPFLEKLNTEERLKLAKKRRSQQMKKWSQREKEYTSVNKRKRSDGETKSNKKSSGYKVHFVPSVMLLEAATRNDVDEVRRLLMLGVSPDSTNEDGLTPLHQCCIDNCEEMMLLLIEFGANVNAKDSEQWTPLHAAATCGHLHLIKILIDKGADLLAVNADGNMPYDICEDEQTLDYIESEMAKRGITQELIDETRAMTENQMLQDLRQLVAHNFDINYKDEQGATPLHIAASNGYMSVVEFLLDHNVSIDECDDDMWQPIHAAACWGHVDVIEYLVQNGADLEAKTKNGETPLDICEDPDLKNRILQLKSEIESKRAVSSNRLRRSHSQNTRTHSIRRTSIREKSQIAKREAIEEARIWHEKAIETIDGKKEDSDLDTDAQFYSDFSRKVSTESPIDLNNIDINMDSAPEYYHHSPSVPYNNYAANNLSGAYSPPNSIVPYKKPDRQMMDSYYSNYYNEYENKSYNPSDCSTTDSSVKVEICVTVNTNSNTGNNVSYNNNSGNTTGTLIDLKKQRSEKARSSLNNIYPDKKMSGSMEHTMGLVGHKQSLSSLGYSAVTSGANQVHSGQSIPVAGCNSTKGHSATAFDSPPSPSTVKKFRGNPSELIGEQEKKGCCLIC